MDNIYSNRQVNGCCPDVKDSRDKKIKRPIKSFIKSILPESVDNRNFIKIIDDQGQEGVCVGASTSKGLEGCYKKDMNSDIDFSIRYLYEFAKIYDEWDGNNYEGTSIRGAMKSLKKMGCCENAYLPYIPKQHIEIKKIVDNANIMNNAKKYCIKDYYSLFGAGSVNIWKLKKAVNDYGFAVCGFYLPECFGEKVIYTIDDNNIDYDSGHAMLVAGYSKEGVIIVNSWGLNFGQNGVCYFDWDLFKETCFSAWCFAISKYK